MNLEDYPRALVVNHERQSLLQTIFDVLFPTDLIKLLYDYTEGETIVVLGGIGGKPAKNLMSVEIIGPNYRKWESLPNLLEPLCGTFATFLHGYLYVMGGLDRNEITNICYRLNLTLTTTTRTELKWEIITSMNEPRYLVGGYIYKDEIYFFGGRKTWKKSGIHISGEKYNYKNNIWTKLNGKLDFPNFHFATCTHENKFYYFGGRSKRPDDFENLSAGVYDPEKDNDWLPLPDFVREKECPIAFILDHKIYIMGTGHSNLEIFNPKNNTWEEYESKGGKYHQTIESFTGSIVWNDKILINGGSSNFLKSTLIWDINKNEWEDTFPDMKEGRFYHSICLI